jgi:hypothetical protein
MRVIHKFKLHIAALSSHDLLLIDMPQGAEILSVGEQYDTLTMWAMVDPEAPMVRRHVAVHGTGIGFDHEELAGMTGCEEPWFVGSVLMHSGAVVLHVFDFGEAR